MNFAFKPAESLTEKERANAQTVISVYSEMAKEKGQAPTIDTLR